MKRKHSDGHVVLFQSNFFYFFLQKTFAQIKKIALLLPKTKDIRLGVRAIALQVSMTPMVAMDTLQDGIAGIYILAPEGI